MPLRIVPVPSTPDEPDNASLAPFERKAHRALATWPRDPAHEQARKLVQCLHEARAALRHNAPIAEYLRAGFLGEIERLADRLDEMDRARREALVRRARRFGGGSKPGRTDALDKVVLTCSRPIRTEAGKSSGKISPPSRSGETRRSGRSITRRCSGLPRARPSARRRPFVAASARRRPAVPRAGARARTEVATSRAKKPCSTVSPGVAPVWWRVHCFRTHTSSSPRFS